MKEVDANPSEELDLLVKWLGPKSSRHAKSIRASKAEIYTVKQNSNFTGILSYYDSSLHINQVVSKLPPRLQFKWTDRAASYKKSHGNVYPPFGFFASLMKEMTSVLNDPGLMIFSHDSSSAASTRRFDNQRRTDIRVKKTDVKGDTQHKDVVFNEGKCIIHDSNHTLNQCRKFREKSLSERKKLLAEHHICFKCCKSNSHLYKNCHEVICCDICRSDKHPTALHPTSDNYQKNSDKQQRVKSSHGEERTPRPVQFPQSENTERHDQSTSVSSQCTRICGKGFSGRSCAKTLLVKLHPAEEPDKFRTVYVILDDQSNKSLGHSEIFDYWGIPASGSVPYTVVSCSGKQTTHGCRLSGLAMTSMDGTYTMNLPTIIECNHIPSNREEIPPPQVATWYPHMSDINLPPVEPEIDIQLLIGRDLPEAFHVTEQRTGSSGDPFAQRLKLGWVIVGETCLGKTHKPDVVSVMKTKVLPDRRVTLFEECANRFQVKDSPDLRNNIFLCTKHDDKPGLSLEDRSFMELMDREFVRTTDGSWSAPLPFRENRPRLPNNQLIALKRARKKSYQAGTYGKFHEGIQDDQTRVWYGPSPAAASYGLRKAAKDAETDYGSDVYYFVQNNFYVDDGLISESTPEEAVSLLTRTQAALATGHIRLHKICSNSQEVLDNFPSKDLAQDLKDLNLGDDDIPSQRSLGLCWRLPTDAFSFKVSDTPKPYTRRGVLSTINSLYDPLGFLAPVIIQGRVLLRDMVEGTVDWDEPLSETQRVKWETWEKSLLHLDSFSIPRRTPISKGDLTNEVHIFADASERAIAAVAYLTLNNNGGTYTTFPWGSLRWPPNMATPYRD
ncbi:uncharacterized protein [Argopecten irradians]|uniref:uncharacterized protein n=1 Tax=Argopecten irradians TaxID=31199 RepID=UPI0037134DCB